MKHDDSKPCSLCFTRTPHQHNYIVHADTPTGFKIVPVDTFYLPTVKAAIENDPMFLDWLDDTWLEILTLHYKGNPLI
jgi:hypothetical protein